MKLSIYMDISYHNNNTKRRGGVVRLTSNCRTPIQSLSPGNQAFFFEGFAARLKKFQNAKIVDDTASIAWESQLSVPSGWV